MSSKKKQQQVQQVYDLKTYIQLHKQLLHYSKIINANTKQFICENIELLTEFSIWGDSNDSNFFDYFFEENIVEQFFQIMKRSSFREITILVIQSFGILLANLQNIDNVTYLLSHPVMNEMIGYNYDFTDEEIVDYYISLLKSLSLRITSQNIHLFFNQRMPIFPLMYQACRFYNHKEIMVRTAVRTIILGIMKVEHEDLKKYLSRFPFILFYVHFTCYLKHIWLELNRELLDSRTNIKERLDDQVDLFYFLQDIYAHCPEVSQIMDNSILTYGLLPALFGGILFQKKETLSLPFSLYLANYFITNFNKSDLSNTLSILLFSPRLQENLAKLIEDNVTQPRSFVYTWSFNNYWDNHSEFLQQQAQSLFSAPTHEIENVQDCKEEMNMINDILGLKGAIGITYCAKQLTKDNNDIITTENKIRHQLIQYLSTKDDNFLYLLLTLWKSVLTTKSKDILRLCLFQEVETTEIVEERNTIIQQLLKVFMIDPALRLCTTLLASQIIIYFLKVDKLALNSDTLTAFYESYQYTIQKIRAQKSFNDGVVNSLTLLQNQYQNNLESIKLNLDYLAFKQVVSTYDVNIDLIYRVPIGLKELANRDLAMFLMLSKIQATIQGKESIDSNSDNLTNSWVIGKNYLPDQRKMLSCQITAKTMRDKLYPCTSGPWYKLNQFSFWIEDEENFIIAETEIVKQDWAKILYNYKIYDVEAVIDRSEPKRLTVSIKIQQQSIKEQYIDVQLDFDDYTYALSAKDYIDKARRQHTKDSIVKIEEMLQKAQNDCDDFYKQQQ